MGAVHPEPGPRDPGPSVDVWVLDLDDRPFEDRPVSEVLSRAELARAAALPADPHGRRFASSRVQLRQVLARYCAVSPPDLEFTVAARGKPALLGERHTSVRFNTSRSAGVGMVAVRADGLEVGVDVECHRREADLSDVAARFFPAAELDRIAGLPAAARAPARYDVWTRVEAELKGIGVGLAGAGCPRGGSLREVIASTGGSAGWWVRALDVAALVPVAVSAAVAVAVEPGRDGPVRVTLREWRPNR